MEGLLTGDTILGILGVFPEEYQHCAFLAAETLQEALDDFMQKQTKSTAKGASYEIKMFSLEPSGFRRIRLSAQTKFRKSFALERQYLHACIRQHVTGTLASQILGGKKPVHAFLQQPFADFDSFGLFRSVVSTDEPVFNPK